MNPATVCGMLVLLASLAAVIPGYAANEGGFIPSEVKAGAPRGKNKGSEEGDSTRVELERLHPQAKPPRNGGKSGNAFGASSWYVPPPPPPPVKPAPPPPPTAPPMPFTFLGLYEAAPKTIIMLVKGDQVYTVSTGDVIENTYRIERVEPGVIEMTYLPLNIKQTLNTGNAM